MVRAKLLIVIFQWFVGVCLAQSEKELVIISVKDNRLELAKAISFLNSNDAKLICINVDLFKCDSTVKTFPSNHLIGSDTLAILWPSEAEKVLAHELGSARSLLLPSELRELYGEKYLAIDGCGFLYPHKAKTGFVNLISKNGDRSVIDRVQIFNVQLGADTAYHFGVKIALLINENATRKFIKSHSDTVQIKTKPRKRFHTYSMDQFYLNKVDAKLLKGKVAILRIDRPEEYRTIAGKRMSASEIMANIACQVVR